MAVLALLPISKDLVFPGSYVATPATAVVLVAVTALGRHDAVLGAFAVGACDGFDLGRFRAGRRLLVVFNVAQLALAGGLAAVVYGHLWSATRWGVVAATATYLAVNVTFAGPLIARQTSVRDLARELRATVAVDGVLAVGGLLVGLLYLRAGYISLLLIVGPMVAARVATVFLVKFQQAFARLESLYDFTSTLDAQGDAGRPMEVLLRQVCTHLGVRRARVTVAVDGGWVGHSVAVDGELQMGAGTGPLPHAGRTPTLVASVDPASSLATDMGGSGMGDGMTAPLLVEGRVIGWLATAGTSNQRSLTSEDLRLLETLANHAAVFIERNQLVERLRHDSTHDLLTSLPNRTRFLELAGRAARPTAVLLADLDRFKEVNDTLGHGHGDLLLVAVARRLSETFADATVARLGGDEFGVLLPATAPGDAAQAAVGLLASLERSFHVGDFDFELTASVGVAVAAEGATPEESGAPDVGAVLLRHADIAMYRAKEAHSGWELYSAERDTHSPWRLSLASDLRRGLSDELEVHFQPKVVVDGGEVCGVEALVRWRHPRYGLLSPDQFVAVAEQTGLIRGLTMAVLSESCAQQTRLEALGFPLDIAVNLSVRSVLDVALPDQVAEVLEHHGVAPGRVIMEITEGSLMADPARTIGVLGRLAGMGISISIDDFGTGYSSLGYLKRLPATEVKIDRSFVSGMLRDRSDDAIVRSTVDLAHNLGLRAVAEGIEDPDTLAALARMGCDLGQGYYLSAPLAAEALLPWLLRNRSEHRPA